MKEVKLVSGSGKLKAIIAILPVHVCGYVSYTSRGEQVGQEISPDCQDCPQKETPGGRHREIICLHPRHYGREVFPLYLTAPEASGLYDQLGEDYDRYVRPASAHGAWKLRRRQGMVVVPK